MSQTQQSGYRPEQLLDTLLTQLQLKNDNELSRRLRVAPHVLRQIRAGALPVGASMLIWMSEATGLSIAQLRELMGDRRRTCRVSVAAQRMARRASN